MRCNYHKTRARLANMSLGTEDMTFSSPNVAFFQVSPASKYVQRRTTPTTSVADYIRVPCVVRFCVVCHERLRNVGICVHWIIQWNCRSINKTDGIKLIHTWRLYGFNIACVFATSKYLEVVPPFTSSQSAARASCWAPHHNAAMSSLLLDNWVSNLYEYNSTKDTTAQPVLVGNV